MMVLNLKREIEHISKYICIRIYIEFMSIVFSVKNLPVYAMLLIINRS